MAKPRKREFPSEILHLKEKVENLTGNKLVMKEGPMTISANETLMSRVENGIPTIIIKPGHAPTDEEIYHELFHLYIKSKSGIYGVEIDGNLKKNLLGRNYNDIQLIIGKACSILHHSFFFNKMLEGGYHPTKYLEEQLKDCLDGYPKNSYVLSDRDIHVALDVWHLALGKVDKDSEVNNLLDTVKQRCPRAYDVGISLFEASHKFLSPSDEPKVLAGIMAKLLCDGEKVNYAVDNGAAIYS